MSTTVCVIHQRIFFFKLIKWLLYKFPVLLLQYRRKKTKVNQTVPFFKMLTTVCVTQTETSKFYPVVTVQKYILQFL